MAQVTVRALYAAKKDDLGLELLTGEETLDMSISVIEVNRLGLCLAGHTGSFMEKSVQVVGQTELGYLAALPRARRREAVESVVGYSLPMIVITRGLEPPEGLVPDANRHAIPVLRSTLPTGELIRRLTAYLEYMLSPRLTVHGTLVDVYGVGLLYTGEAAIGKSECALDLIERGHRLIADDVVTLFRRGRVVIGQANELTGFHMEIRGVGIVNAQALFGIRAVGMHKRVEVVVNLAEWTKDNPQVDYDRLGIEYEHVDMLGVEIPRVSIPIFPGKNITVISEVVAMNHILRVHGCNAAMDFEKRMIELLSQKRSAESYFLDAEE
ncbi:HPr(Ser) kinase/phosphatase [Candidatus Fermentibacteria bacterium]|nr:HPr(Ser) kinase/phosphatase [Candidatus Fermentibacteria bacterium]